MTSEFLSGKVQKSFFAIIAFGLLPLGLAIFILGLWNFDLTVPIIYTHSDDIWQLILTKVLTQTGWVLFNPYLGAPEIASWHHNAAAQTSALHSLLMYLLSFFISDAVKVQQLYYLLNFPLILISGYIAGRMLRVRPIYAYAFAMLFAFTSYRIHYLLYAFLSNYFSVPIVVATIILLLSGDFDSLFRKNADESISLVIRRVLANKRFMLGLAAITAIAISDGYFAFFTLLLLGFVFTVKLVLFSRSHLAGLAPSAVCIFILMGLVIALNIPLQIYKHNHKDEFAPNGQVDTTLVKKNYEAEVYSSSLKLMIAPIGTHRVKAIADFGDKMVASSDYSRVFKTVNTNASLGMIGTVGLALAFLGIFVKNVLTTPIRGEQFNGDNYRYSGATLSVILFIFLCSIFGGLGTLVALIFPTIRAYDRFLVFMHFGIFLYLGLLLSRWNVGGMRSKNFWILCIGLATLVGLGIYDQTPRDSHKYDQQNVVKFLAERKFIQAVESELKPGAMVYQYPYSQYLRQNKYYGWGVFSHVRFYLHSKDIHWSNGGAKNSPADDWNFRLSKLELKNIIPEIEALGFSGVLIDKGVFSDIEYAGVKNFFEDAGFDIREDGGSNLAFVKLNKSPIFINYAPDYKSIESIRIDDPAHLTGIELPRLVNRQAFEKLVTSLQPVEKGLEIDSKKNGEIFRDVDLLMRGSGEAIIPIEPGLKGRVTCEVKDYIHARNDGVLNVKIHNDGEYDWFLNEGQYPLRLGMHVTDNEGKMRTFDDGTRFPVEGVVPAGSEKAFSVPFKPVVALQRYSVPFTVDFVMVQDGNAWFAGMGCQVVLK